VVQVSFLIEETLIGAGTTSAES